eukprot:m.20190 g.20190  ORF g.20190 m.20190 type:complete len:140 (-) comp3813_c0_seq2:186-605(-)
MGKWVEAKDDPEVAAVRKMRRISELLADRNEPGTEPLSFEEFIDAIDENDKRTISLFALVIKHHRRREAAPARNAEAPHEINLGDLLPQLAGGQHNEELEAMLLPHRLLRRRRPPAVRAIMTDIPLLPFLQRRLEEDQR